MCPKCVHTTIVLQHPHMYTKALETEETVGDTRYLLGRDVQRDCPEIHLLVSLDTGQYKKEACRMDGRRRKETRV